MTMNNVSNSSLLLSAQRALFDNVTPNLRRVYVAVEQSKLVLYLFYDKPLSEEEEDLATLTHAYFLADFPNYDSDLRVPVVPYPEKTTFNAERAMMVYSRHEPDYE